MAKFRIEREMVRSQVAYVEAIDEDNALDIAENNEELFEESLNNDLNWHYVTPIKVED